MPPSFADSPLPRRYRIGDWTVDPRAGQLRRGSESLRLEPKVMGVLSSLAVQAGEVVTRDELLDAVWPDVVVTGNALSRCVSDLRRALGDDPRTPKLIETIPKTGYRLLVPVEPIESESPPFVSGDGVPVWEVAAPPLIPGPNAQARHRVGRHPLALVLLAAACVALTALAVRSQRPTALDPILLSTPRPVTAAAGTEGLAALSPAGDRVAYVRFAEGTQTGHLELIGVEGGSPLALTANETDTYPVFSPDGQHLAFLRCEDAGCRPYRVSALGTDERLLADITAQPSGLDWSPDGRFLAYVEQAAPDSPAHLSLLDLTTGERRPLTSPPMTVLGDLFPTFSPDGSQIAFVRRTDAVNGDLLTVPVAGGDPVALSADRSQIARMSWFPDSRSILAASDRDGTFRLWRFHTEGTPPDPFPIEAAMPIGPTVSDDGTRLVVEAWSLPIQLWHYDFSAPDPTRHPVAPSTRWDRMPSLSPDAHQVVFVSTRSGHAELWTADTDGGSARQLTHLNGPAVQAPQWAPDGRHIAFLMRTDGQSDLYTIPTDGGVPQRLTATDADEAHPRWSPDSRTLFAGRRGEERWEGIRLDLETRTETRLLPKAVVLAPSPDGQALWFTRDDAPGLWQLPLTPNGSVADDQEAELIVHDLTPRDAALWAVTDGGLVYVRQSEAREDLARWTAGLGSETLAVGPLGLDLWFPSLSASQDGSTVVVAQMEMPEVDILTAELKPLKPIE